MTTAVSLAGQNPDFKDSNQSWKDNSLRLLKISSSTSEEAQTLQFLEKLWLTKSSGFSYFERNFLASLIQYPLQTHPLSTSSYARDPHTKMQKNYEYKLNEVKLALGLPENSNLILCRKIAYPDRVDFYRVIQDLSELNKTYQNLSILDLSQVVQRVDLDSFLKEHETKNTIFVIHHEIEGFSALEILSTPLQKAAFLEEKVLEIISSHGLAPNFLELNRLKIPQEREGKSLSFQRSFSEKRKAFSFFLKNYSHESLLIQAIRNMLLHLLENSSSNCWDKVDQSLVYENVVSMTLHQLEILLNKVKGKSFLATVNDVEEMNCHLMTLLEILKPYSLEMFKKAYADISFFIPSQLRPLSNFSLHNSAMTSISGVIRSARKTYGNLKVYCGENTYFEIFNLLQPEEITQENPNLFIVQFNPVLKRDIPKDSFVYSIEKISAVLEKALASGKVTVAVDITLDDFESFQLNKLLEDLQEPILNGLCNVILYKSGVKFDLFGLDHCAVAPVCLIQNGDSKWGEFTSFCDDVMNITDVLSISWLTLAYQSVYPMLKAYRESIIGNTKEILSKIPPKFFSKSSEIQVMNFEDIAEPAFIDIRVKGSFHYLKASVLVAGSLVLDCITHHYPIFFRKSFGFYHPNFGIIFKEDESIIRLTIGSHSDQVDLISNWFAQIASFI